MSSSATHPIQVLKGRFSEGRLHHGILLLGGSLSQLETSCQELIREIFSLNESKKEHPDLFHLRPAGKARIISVEKTRELISKLNRTSNQGGAKVAVIHEADRMRKEAANAFLKTLEEPPPDTYLLLLSTRAYSLLATIRSRCLLTRIPIEKDSKPDDQWESWKCKYQQWIRGLLDRDNLKKDRVSPLFAAYGLTTSLLELINQRSEEVAKQAKQESPGLDDKEMDALEVGVRKGIRSTLLRKLADCTCSFVTSYEKQDRLPNLGIKLSRVLLSLEKNVQLMEVNLKDEAAIEDFYLSSLRIWSAK